MTKVFEVIAAKKAGFPASAPAEASMDVQPQPVQTPDEARDAPMPDGNFIPEAPNPLHQRLASIQESIDSLHDESTACTAALEKLTLNADTLTHQQKAIATKMDQLLETQKDLKTLVMGNIEGAGNA